MSRMKSLEVATAPRLEAEASVVMEDLRKALGELLERSPGRPGRAIELERGLGISKKLAWQVIRIAKSETLGEIANVPSRASVRTLTAAARKHGVPGRVLDRVATAFEAFDKFAESRADDRASLVTMLGGTTSLPGDSYEVNVRKAAFKANAHIWGNKVEKMIRAVAFHPTPSRPDLEDVALVIGDIGLQRLREGGALNMVRWFRTADTPNQPEAMPGLDLSSLVDRGVNLLPEFCTHPLPRMVPTPSVLGGIETELVIPTGRSGAVTVYSEQLREKSEAAPHPVYDLRLFVTIPVESVVLDMMVPVGLTNPATVRAVVYGRRPHPEHVYDERMADLLPQRESGMYLGAMEVPPAASGAPRYQEAVRHTLSKNGWLGGKFDVYRLSVEYPVLHTLLCVRADAARK